MREFFLAKQVHKSYWSPQRVIQPQKYEKLQIPIASTSEEAKYFFAHLQSVRFVDNSWAKHSAANKSPGYFVHFPACSNFKNRKTIFGS